MTERRYQNGVGLENAIDNAKYNNNDPVTYTLVNQTSFVIDSWENVPALTKTAIDLAATTSGFTAT
jgi:hypothetical protein